MTSPICPICGRDPWAAYFNGDTNFERAFAPCEHETAALEAEEAAGVRSLDIEERDLGESLPGCHLEAFVGAWRWAGFSVVAMAVQPDLTPARKRARELEAHGYYRRSHAFLRKLFAGRKQSFADGLGLFGETRSWSPPAYTVAAITSVVAEMEPAWVTAVREARRYADDLRVVAAWCALPLPAVMGCERVLRASVPPKEVS